MLDILDLRHAFLSPVMAEGEEDNEDGEDEENEDGEDGGDASAEESEHVKKLNAEAKKHRLRAKELARKLAEKEKEEHERAEKEKPEIERLKGQVESLKRQNREGETYKIRSMVLEKALELHITDPEKVDYFQYKLDRSGLLKLDEEGDLSDEFEEAAKKLAKEIAGTEKDSGSGGDRTEEEEEEPVRRPLPKSPNLSGKKKSGRETDLDALRRKYPALTQRN